MIFYLFASRDFWGAQMIFSYSRKKLHWIIKFWSPYHIKDKVVVSNICFVIFIPIFGWWSNLTSISFSNGLVEPPTSNKQHFFCSQILGRTLPPIIMEVKIGPSNIGYLSNYSHFPYTPTEPWLWGKESRITCFTYFHPCLNAGGWAYQPLPGPSSRWPSEFGWRLVASAGMMGVSQKTIPQNGWFIRENPIRTTWFLGVTY